jgi:transcriptional regulator GlxA family with amidase domain
MKRILAAVLASLTLILPTARASAPMGLSAPTAVLMEKTTGKILYEENATHAEQATALATVFNRADRLIPEDRRILLESMNEEIPRILEYVYRNVSADLNADTIARAFNISRAKLDRDFRQYVGRTVHQTVIDCRLSTAIDLLKNTDRTVAQIAADCGFESEYYFYSFCKRNTGSTPSALRRKKDLIL